MLSTHGYTSTHLVRHQPRCFAASAGGTMDLQFPTANIPFGVIALQSRLRGLWEPFTREFRFERVGGRFKGDLYLSRRGSGGR